MTYSYRRVDDDVKVFPVSFYSATITVTPTTTGSQVDWNSAASIAATRATSRRPSRRPGCDQGDDRFLRSWPKKSQDTRRKEVIFARGLRLVLALAAPVSARAAERVYATSQDGSAITEIDATGTHAAFTSLPGPVVIAAAPDGRRLFLSHPEHSAVSVIDTVSKKTIARFAYPGMPFGIVSMPPAIVSSSRIGRAICCRVLDAKSGKLLRETRVGRSPAHVAFDAARHRLFVCEREANAIGVYDSGTFAAIKTIPSSARRRSLSPIPRRRPGSMSPMSAAIMVSVHRRAQSRRGRHGSRRPAALWRRRDARRQKAARHDPSHERPHGHGCTQA